MPISCMFALPTSSAPAARRRATTVASCAGRRAAEKLVPTVVGYPAWSISSLIATGTPSNGPIGGAGSPARRRRAGLRHHIVAIHGDERPERRRVTLALLPLLEEPLGDSLRRGRFPRGRRE